MAPDGQKYPPWPIRLHGAPAQTALRHTRGRVIAVFKRSFYLQTASGLACIGPLGLGAGPLNALADLPPGLDWQASGLRLETPVRRIDNLLCIGSGFFRFVIGDSFLWQPPARPALKPPLLRQGLAMLAAAVTRQQPAAAHGLGRLIPVLIAGELPRFAAGDVLLRAIAAACGDIAVWLAPQKKAGAQTLPVPETLAGLLGMGPGLTPSGDDFIAGVLLALRFLGKDRQADRLAGETLANAKSRTGLISYHHLSAAARGQVSAAVHAMLCALGEGRLRLDKEIGDINAIGHSSGWDTLAGITAVLAQYNLHAHQASGKAQANSAA